MSFPSQIRAMTLLATLPMGLVACASLPDMETRLASMTLSPDVYTARPGDSLESIAFRYQMNPAELAALNPLVTFDGNIAGQKVKVHELLNEQAIASNGLQRSSSGSTILAPQRPATTTVTPVITQPAIIQSAPPPVATAELDYSQLLEVPASSTSTPVTSLPLNPAPQSGPIEEVVADELEYASLPQATPQPLGAANTVGGWVWPTQGQVAREFAPTEAGGQGIDIAGVPGQQIHAANGGTVAYAGRDLGGGDGKLIILRHSNGLMTTYSHARQLFVAEDDVVRAGDVIASLGSNARNESVLRFEVRQNGNPLNPMQFIGN